jgi:hypothetical protein
VVEGKPFFVDMTFAAEESGGETYLGFDFGTSTSAYSVVSSADIQLVEQRAKSAEWRELGDLVSELPYPVAAPLARYMSEMDADRRSERGREAAEAMLTLGAYVCYRERCTSACDGALFKGLQHRSAGPLWNLFKQSLKSGSAKLLFGSRYRELLEGSTFQQMDAWISQIAMAKHSKLASVDYVSLLSILANTTARALGEARLGVFEDVTAKRFGRGQFTGIFRSLSGSAAPFIEVWAYEGGVPFSDADVFLVHPEKRTGLNLAPLYFWGLEPLRPGRDADLYEYDNERTGLFCYKAVQLREEFRVSESGDLSEVWAQIADLRKKDVSAAYLTDLSLASHSFT